MNVGVNPLVHQYTDALWWATMDAVTVGCNIEAVTPVGKVLSVIVAALGIMMFPIFTVYITNAITYAEKYAKSVRANDQQERNVPQEAKSSGTSK